MNRELVLVLILVALIAICIAVSCSEYYKHIKFLFKRRKMLKSMAPDERKAYLKFMAERNKRGDE